MSKTKVNNKTNNIIANRRSVKKPRIKPVAELLSVVVIECLRDRLAEPMTASRVREIAKEFDTENQFGVTPRRLGCYLRKLQEISGKPKQSVNPTAKKVSKKDPRQATDQVNNPSEKNESEDWSKRVQSHRRRQVTIASILDSTFGKMAEYSPDLWAKRAYLMLVGVVYDRLVSDEKELETDELIKLAKVLAEGRRAELRAKESESAFMSTRRTITNGTMPKHLVDTVRQIYGVSLEDSASADRLMSDESKPEDSSQSRLPYDLSSNSPTDQ